MPTAVAERPVKRTAKKPPTSLHVTGVPALAWHHVMRNAVAHTERKGWRPPLDQVRIRVSVEGSSVALEVDATDSYTTLKQRWAFESPAASGGCDLLIPVPQALWVKPPKGGTLDVDISEREVAVTRVWHGVTARLAAAVTDHVDKWPKIDEMLEAVRGEGSGTTARALAPALMRRYADHLLPSGKQAPWRFTPGSSDVRPQLFEIVERDGYSAASLFMPVRIS